jgi:uncharacterized membrane protein
MVGALRIFMEEIRKYSWREASAVFLVFAIGACISLISQIYNIPGHHFLSSNG